MLAPSQIPILGKPNEWWTAFCCEVANEINVTMEKFGTGQWLQLHLLRGKLANGQNLIKTMKTSLTFILVVLAEVEIIEGLGEAVEVEPRVEYPVMLVSPSCEVAEVGRGEGVPSQLVGGLQNVVCTATCDPGVR